MTIQVLLADDHALFREGLRALLQATPDIRVCGEVATGYEAIAAVARCAPEVVILDVSMPDMDGFEVCARLRADVATAFVPVLMLTAHDSAEYVTRGFGVGADDYIVKPFRRDDLVARVRRMLERTYGTESVKRAASGTADKPATERSATACRGGAGAGSDVGSAMEPTMDSATSMTPGPSSSGSTHEVAWAA